MKDTLEGTQKALRKEKAAGNAAMIDDAVSKMSESERAKVHAQCSGRASSTASCTLYIFLFSFIYICFFRVCACVLYSMCLFPGPLWWLQHFRDDGSRHLLDF